MADSVTQLRELWDMHKEGALTLDEFKQLKCQVMQDIEEYPETGVAESPRARKGTYGGAPNAYGAPPTGDDDDDDEYVIAGPDGKEITISKEEAMAAGGPGVSYEKEVPEDGPEGAVMTRDRGIIKWMIGGAIAGAVAYYVYKGTIKKKPKKNQQQQQQQGYSGYPPAGGSAAGYSGYPAVPQPVSQPTSGYPPAQGQYPTGRAHGSSAPTGYGGGGPPCPFDSAAGGGGGGGGGYPNWQDPSPGGQYGGGGGGGGDYPQWRDNAPAAPAGGGYPSWQPPQQQGGYPPQQPPMRGGGGGGYAAGGYGGGGDAAV